MLTLLAGTNALCKHRFCDGISRRAFLRLGALAMGGLSMPSLLRAEQQAGRPSAKSVIMLYLSAGPSFAGARVESDALGIMRLREVSAEQFQERRGLLQTMYELRREYDNAPVVRMDTSYQQAFEVLTSNRLVDALDLSKEHQSVR